MADYGYQFDRHHLAFKMFRHCEVNALDLTQNSSSISLKIMFKVLLYGGKIVRYAAPQGTRVYGQSKFRFTKEACGYSYVLLRSLLYRARLVYWF